MPGVSPRQLDRNDKVLVAKIMMLKTIRQSETVHWENALASSLGAENDLLFGHHDPGRSGDGV